MKKIRIRHTNGTDLTRTFSAKILGGVEALKMLLQWKHSVTKLCPLSSVYKALQ